VTSLPQKTEAPLIRLTTEESRASPKTLADHFNRHEDVLQAIEPDVLGWSTRDVGAITELICPVCGWPHLSELPRSQANGGSYEMCWSCGFEFGVTDDALGYSYDDWRWQWVAHTSGTVRTALLRRRRNPPATGEPTPTPGGCHGRVAPRSARRVTDPRLHEA